jgi:hypothetical protein
LAAGEISYAHARALSTATADVDPGEVAKVEVALVDAARSTDPRIWGRCVRRGGTKSTPTDFWPTPTRRSGSAG